MSRGVLQVARSMVLGLDRTGRTRSATTIAALSQEGPRPVVGGPPSAVRGDYWTWTVIIPCLLLCTTLIFVPVPATRTLPCGFVAS